MNLTFAKFKVLKPNIALNQALNPLQVGIIHLIHTQSFPKNCYLLPPDMHTDLWVSGGKKI